MAKLGNKQAANELKDWKQRNEWIKVFLRCGIWPKDCPKEQQSYLEIDAKYLKEAQFYGFGYDSDAGFPDDYKRDDPILIKAVKSLGKKANGKCASLAIVKIPNNVEWIIEEYDGAEHISEKHRTWR